MDKRSGDRDSAFTWAMGNLILARIADGETMKAITADARMPAYRTVFRWMQVVPEFGDRVAELRALMARARQSERDARRLVRKGRGRRRAGGQKPRVPAAALNALLARVRDGASMSEAVAQPGAPSSKALYTRVRGCPGFRAAFVDACGWRNRWLELQVDLVGDDVMDEALGIPAANAEIAALKGRRGRLTPKLYREAPRRAPALTPPSPSPSRASPRGRGS